MEIEKNLNRAEYQALVIAYSLDIDPRAVSLRPRAVSLRPRAVSRWLQMFEKVTWSSRWTKIRRYNF